MIDKNDIQEDMVVVGSDGKHIGTVDKVEGDQIKLTKNDSQNGQHNYISTEMVESCEGDTIKLTLTAADAMVNFGDSGGEPEQSESAAGSVI